MRNFFLLLPLVAVLTAPALHSQSAGDPNEGVRIVPSTTPDHYLFSWWGRQGRFYVIQHSTDLRSAWSHIPAIEPGYGEVAQWGFATNADMFFLRLIYTDDPLTGAFHGDDDGDGIANGVEVLLGYSAVTANGNSDGDLLTDRQELALGLDPDDPADAVDADGDGVVDAIERLHGLSTSGTTDLDGDSMNDEWELKYYLDLHIDDSGLDPDDDGLTNLQEFNQGTNPRAFDTDGDTLPDGLEVASGLDPLTADPVHRRNNHAWRFATDLTDRFGEFSDRISESSTHSLALDKNGNVYAWGGNTAGQLAQGPGTAGTDLTAPTLTQFDISRSVAAGTDTSHVVNGTGLAQAAGNNYLGRLGDGTAPSGNPTVVETPVSVANLTAVKRIHPQSEDIGEAIAGNSRELYAWGWLSSSDYVDGSSQTGVPQGPYKAQQDMVSLSSSWNQSTLGPTAAVSETGDLVLWGRNRGYSMLQPDVFFNTSASQKVHVNAVEPVSYASVKFEHAMSLNHDGELSVWGRFNGFGGKLYFEPAPGQLTPSLIDGHEGIRAMAMAAYGSDGSEFEQKPGYFIDSEGKLWTFFRVIERLEIVSQGSSGSAHTEFSRLEISQIPSARRFYALAEGYDSILLLADDGAVYRYSTIDSDYTYIEHFTSSSGSEFETVRTEKKPAIDGSLVKLDIPNFYDLTDLNSDGLNDLSARFFGLNPNSTDTNGDGLSDAAALASGLDAVAWDNDGDGIPNAVEIAKGLNPNAGDSDGDGMPDNEELFLYDRLSNYILPTSADSRGPAIHLASPGNATEL